MALMLLCCLVAQSWQYAFVVLAYSVLMLCTDANVALLVAVLSLAWAPNDFLVSSFDTCAIMSAAILVFTCACVVSS